MSDYKMPPMFNLGSKENYERFMSGQDAKDAEVEEEFEETYKDVERTEIPFLEKEQGKKKFLAQNYFEATKHYSKALLAFQFLVKDNQIQDEQTMERYIQEIDVPCNLNLSICYFKMKDYYQSLHFAEKANKIDPTNVKALYRMGVAHLFMANFEESKSYLKQAYDLDPQNKDVQMALEDLVLQKKRSADKLKKMSEKMVNNSDYSDGQVNTMPPQPEKTNTRKQQNKIDAKDGQKKVKQNKIQQIFSDITYHAKITFLTIFDQISTTCCRRKGRVPSSAYKKNK